MMFRIGIRALGKRNTAIVSVRNQQLASRLDDHSCGCRSHSGFPYNSNTAHLC